jgi:hypothetical protein
MTIWRSPCPTCNFHKSVHLEGFDEHERTQVRLFNPRTDDWHSHFAFQELTLRVSAHGTSTCPRRSTLPASRKDLKLWDWDSSVMVKGRLSGAT